MCCLSLIPVVWESGGRDFFTYFLDCSSPQMSRTNKTKRWWAEKGSLTEKSFQPHKTQFIYEFSWEGGTPVCLLKCWLLTKLLFVTDFIARYRMKAKTHHFMKVPKNTSPGFRLWLASKLGYEYLWYFWIKQTWKLGKHALCCKLQNIAKPTKSRHAVDNQTYQSLFYFLRWPWRDGLHLPLLLYITCQALGSFLIWKQTTQKNSKKDGVTIDLRDDDASVLMKCWTFSNPRQCISQNILALS